MSRCVGCWCDQLCPPVRSLPLPGGHRHGDILQHQQVGRYLLQQHQVGRYLLQPQQLGRYLLQHQQFRVDCNFLVKKFHVHNIKSYNQLTLKEVFKVFIKIPGYVKLCIQLTLKNLLRVIYNFLSEYFY